MDKRLMESLVTKLFQEVSAERPVLDIETVDKIIKDIDVASALNKIKRSAAGKVLTVWSDKEENAERAKEITDRFSEVKFNRIVKHLISARLYGYSCFEIIYSEDFRITSLIPIPVRNIDYKEKKWILKIGGEERDLNREKFLLNIHEWNPGKPQGVSILEECSVAFLDKETFSSQLRGIAKKYGDVITFFLHDERMSKEEVEEIADSVKEMQGKNAVAVPTRMNGTDMDISKMIHFIRLSDLDPEIYTRLEDREKKKLVQNILGATLTMDSDGKGSYALGEVHQGSFEEVVEEVCNFVADSMYQLIEIDAGFYGYDPKEFYWKMEPKRDAGKEAELTQKKENVKAVKLDNITKLRENGYALEKDYLANYLGIDPKHLEEVEITAPAFEFSKGKKKDLLEARKQFSRKQKEIFEGNFQNRWISISEEINKASKINFKAFDIDNPSLVSLNMEGMEKFFILSILQGYSDGFEKPIFEFSEEGLVNSFDLPFEEAINYFLKKTPVLYDKLEYITETAKTNFFWLKKSTELEVTNRILKSLQKAIENGITYKEWHKGLDNELIVQGLGNNGYYSELVFRNNMMTAYNVGHYMQRQDNIENQPYGLYDGIGDDRQSNICKALDGKVYKLSNPIWNRITPPNHHLCRSSVIAMSAEEIEEYGLSLDRVTNEVKNLDLGSFEGNPALGYAKTLEKSSKKKEKQNKELIESLAQYKLF